MTRINNYIYMASPGVVQTMISSCFFPDMLVEINSLSNPGTERHSAITVLCLDFCVEHPKVIRDY